MLARQTPAQMAVCGNGITEPGEQCDVADTPSGVDECDGCNTDCTVTAECGLGPCTDNIDNDGDGLIDEQDPKCSSFHGFSTFAVSAANGKSTGIRVGIGGRLAQSDVPDGASICGRLVDMRSLATVAGSVIAINGSRFSHHQSSGIGGRFVTTTGITPLVPWAPALVGSPMGTCSTSSTACLTALDCASPEEECVGRQKLNAVNPSVDLTGTGAGSDELARCNTVLAKMLGDTSLLTLTGPPLGRMRISRANPLSIDVAQSGTVLDYESFAVGEHGVLTINGVRGSALVIRVEKRLAFKAGARIELSGGITPESILWLAVGGRRAVTIEHDLLFQGFLWAPQRSIVVGSRAEVRGSLVGRKVRVGPHATIEHHPFLSLLPSDVAMAIATSPDPVAAGSAMTYHVDITNNGPGFAQVVNLRFDLDPRTTFIRAVPSQGVCLHDGSPSGGTVRCYLGDLPDSPAAPANQATVQIDASVDAGATGLQATATLGHTIAANGDLVIPVSTVVAP